MVIPEKNSGRVSGSWRQQLPLVRALAYPPQGWHLASSYRVQEHLGHNALRTTLHYPHQGSKGTLENVKNLFHHFQLSLS